MTAPDSVFLRIPEGQWIANNASCFAIFDANPASPGHVLVIPHRLVASWFAATSEEVSDAIQLVSAVKRHLDERFTPDGYNVGFNDGAASGQSIFHAHLHVIPRYASDVPHAAGGIRHAAIGHGNY
ncbi:HIT family protein [Gryllotalpicola reticulitermitis]|uniref:HIT family protein n=1 Tax=Gryllotalpicola reticulitermitis TaxID=1184153 RepID=A0ABV8Q356_9MICO